VFLSCGLHYLCYDSLCDLKELGPVFMRTQITVNIIAPKLIVNDFVDMYFQIGLCINYAQSVRTI